MSIKTALTGFFLQINTHKLAIFAVVCCLWLGWLVTQLRFTPHEDSIHFNEAVFVADNGLCPESIADNLLSVDVVPLSLPDMLSVCVNAVLAESPVRGKTVSLPHEWRSDLPTNTDLQSGRGVYRMRFPFTVAPTGLWALSLPATGQNPAVFVNGTLLGWGGSFERPVARNISRPLLFTIPEGVLQAGENQFDIYLVSEPAQGGFLDTVHIGPVEMLNPAHQVYTFFRHTFPQIIVLIVIVLSFGMAILWLYRRKEVEYGLFALEGGFWAIHTLDQSVVNIPVSTHLWDWINVASAGGMSITGIFFIHRFLQEYHPRREQALLAGSVSLALLLLILPDKWFYPISYYVWNPLVLLGGIYALLFTIHRATKLKNYELYALSVAGSMIVFWGLYDVLVLIGVNSLSTGFFLHFAALFLLFSFSWILLQRFVHSLQAIEDANQQLLKINQELEQRVEEKTKKIAQSYETIRLLGQEQVLLHERSRIMRDMHDGIGVYLTSMLRQLEKDPVDRNHLREAARNALNDLRLMIDSLGSASSDLPAMLGMFRTRISVALDACQVELDWQVDELPPLPDFGPERALNLLRILQEAFTNALKHSGANCIKLRACVETNQLDESRIRVEVQDNGKGFSASEGSGNGLQNMRYRAQKIKADFRLETNSAGTCIVIRLPLFVNQTAFDSAPLTNTTPRYSESAVSHRNNRHD